MAWVKEHIGAFGGDGDDITIFGESERPHPNSARAQAPHR